MDINEAKSFLGIKILTNEEKEKRKEKLKQEILTSLPKTNNKKLDNLCKKYLDDPDF